MKFAVFSKRDVELYVQATGWHASRADAQLDAEMNTDLGMEGQPDGRMGVMIDGRIYIEHRYVAGTCDGKAPSIETEEEFMEQWR